LKAAKTNPTLLLANNKNLDIFSSINIFVFSLNTINKKLTGGFYSIQESTTTEFILHSCIALEMVFRLDLRPL
jgi:hypothetical protein